MTATTDTEDALLGRIHEAGYWRVLILPNEYEEERLPSLARCEEIVREADVRLRGWPYPYIDPREGIRRHDRYIQSSVDWSAYIELWRLYQSGQFVHHFAIHSDRYGPMSGAKEGQIRPGPRVLDFVDLVYTLTEILQFARGLAYRDALGSRASIRIELHGTKGRITVAPPDRAPFLPGRYSAEYEPILWKNTALAAELIADGPRLAIDAAMHILERFNWPDPNRGMLEKDQQRLLERRL